MTAGPPPDDLDVRLRWPEVEEQPAATAPRRSRSRKERVTPAKAQPRLDGDPDDEFDATLRESSRSLSTELAVAKPSLDSTHAALASIALRLDALTSATALLRNSVNDRLTEYGEQQLRVQSAGNRDLEDYRRLQDRSLANLEAGLTASEEALNRLERSAADAMGEYDRISRHFDTRIDHVQGLMEEVAKRPDVDLAPVHQALAGIEEVLDGLAQRPDASAIDLTHLDQALVGINDALEVIASRPEPVPVDLAPVHSTLAGVQEVLDQLAVRPVPTPDLAPLWQALTELQSAVDQLVERPAPDHSALQESLDELHQAVADLAARPDAPAQPEVVAALSRIERALAGVTAPASGEAAPTIASDDVERLLAAITEVASRQNTAGDDLTAMSKAQQATTRSQLAVLTTLQDGVAGLQDRLSAMEDEGEGSEEEGDLEAVLREVVGEIVGRLDSATMAIADEVQSVTRSVDALRRRLAVRARSESALDEPAISALAEAVARRLSQPPAPSAPAGDPPRSSARRRGSRA